MNKIILVALMSGQGKAGKPWYRAILKTKTSDGSSIVREHWLDEKVAKATIQAGLTDDCEVSVTCGLDEYLRPTITGISSVDDEVLL